MQRPIIVTDTVKYDPRDPHKIRVPWAIKRVGSPEPHGSWIRVKLIGEHAQIAHQFYPRERADQAQLFVDTFRQVAQQQIRSVGEVLNEYIEHIRVYGGAKGRPVRSWEHRRGLLLGILGLVDTQARRANRGKGSKKREPMPITDLPLLDLTEARAQMLYSRRTKAVAPDTHHTELMWAREFCRWCVEKGYLKANPFEHVLAIGEKSVGKEQLTIDESERFLEVALNDGHLASFAAAAVLMMGVRSNEMLLRTVRDLDANGTILRIPLGARKVKTKHSARAVYIPEQLQGKFRTLAAAASNGMIDPKQTGPQACLFGKMHMNTLLKTVKRICADAGLPQVCTHGLRGSYASNEVESGVPVQQVSRSVGHGGVGVTRQHYLRPGSEQTQRARQWEGRLGTTPPADDSQSPQESTNLGTSEPPTTPARHHLSLVP